MRTFLWWLFVAIVFTPMTIMVLIAAEALNPRLDPITLRNPSAIRDIVAEVAMSFAGFDKDSAAKIDRVLKLSPNNAEARSRQCSAEANNETQAGSDKTFADCTKAVALEPSWPNWNALGLTQEQRGDPCTAEESFTSANTRVNAAYPFIMRNIGRAAYACGHVPSAVASFEIAETKDNQEVAVGAAEHKDEDDQQDDKDSLRLDRDWLILTYAQNRQSKLATQMCSAAHPDWKSCNCAATHAPVPTVRCQNHL